jgi:hypothetical protein
MNSETNDKGTTQKQIPYAVSNTRIGIMAATLPTDRRVAAIISISHHECFGPEVAFIKNTIPISPPVKLEGWPRNYRNFTK